MLQIIFEIFPLKYNTLSFKNKKAESNTNDHKSFKNRKNTNNNNL